MTEGEELVEQAVCRCQACGRAFIGDLLVSDEVWGKIAPKNVEGRKGGGLLCPTCIVDRVVGAGIASAVHAYPDAHFPAVGEVGALKSAQERIAELEALFDLSWKADIRAINTWRANNPGNDLVMPDSAELSVWLLEQLSAAVEALRPFAEYAPYVEMFVEGRATSGGSPVLPTKHFRRSHFSTAREVVDRLSRSRTTEKMDG